MTEIILADLNQYTTATRLIIILTDDAIIRQAHVRLAISVTHNKQKPYNSSTPIKQFLTFSFTSQRERQARKDERSHHGAMDKS